MKKENGITLVALILTIVVMLIIAGVSIYSGTESLDNTRLQGFYTKLEIVQKRVDDIATTNESYVDSSGNTVYLKEQGTAYEDLTLTQQNTLQNIIANEGAELGLIATNFRYFTSAQLKSILDLSDIEYNVFIDFENRVIIAEDGITANGTTYHILKNTTYFAQQNTNKNVGTIESLSYNIIKYGTDSYKITVTPSNSIGDLNIEGTLKYKKSTSKYWETSTEVKKITEENDEVSAFEMIINELTDYNVIYEDVNKNIYSATIKVEVVENEDGTTKLNVTEVTEEESEEV